MATGCCNKSPRVTCENHCRCDLSHKFKLVWIRATHRSDKQGQATCCSNSADEATCRSDVSLRFVPSCVSALNVKRTRTRGLKMATVKIQHKNCLQSTLRKKIINTLFAGLGRSVLGKTVPFLGYGPRPQDLWHSFSQYGPPGRQITYM